MLRSRVERRAALEGVPAGQQHVDDAGERVNVVARFGNLALELLTARVSRGRHGNRLPRFEFRDPRTAFQFMRSAEVQDTYVPVARNEDVVRVDVAVHDTTRVR